MQNILLVRKKVMCSFTSHYSYVLKLSHINMVSAGYKSNQVRRAKSLETSGDLVHQSFDSFNHNILNLKNALEESLKLTFSMNSINIIVIV